MAQDDNQYLHREWLGLLQSEGLVVSPPALVDAQAVVDKPKALELQPVLQSLTEQSLLKGKPQTWVPDFSAFVEQVLEWNTEDFVAPDQFSEKLSVYLDNYGETLQADYGVVDEDSDRPLLLVKLVALGQNFDQDDEAAGTTWKATVQQKFERLLQGVKVPIGVLWNQTHLRLVYAPSGESSGHVTFPIEAMTEVSGRTILGALEMLLGAQRLFNVPLDKTLLRLLEASRNYQATVSNKLAEQVLDALWELLRGFQAADAQRDREDRSESDLQLLAKSNPQHVYGGLLTTLMRLVFLLYAEDRGLMPGDSVYQGNYSVSGLYEKLRADAAMYPDTMDQRFGAWAWLLSLFRLVYDGGGAYEAYLPARHGQLFDPAEYAFLEGQNREIPRVADGVVYRLLENLLILEGERLSYRALDVEQIGSVYEAIMGYEVAIATERSIAVRPKDVVVGLDTLLAAKPAARVKVLKEEGELTLAGKSLAAFKKAETMDELLAALGRQVSGRTQQVLMQGALYLQPGEERRRTGSHYTPRKLTQPIVETTLRPVLEQLGPSPTAEQLLELKVCDLAMGSAAFLVEACRQLGDVVVAAWDVHGSPVDLPDAIDPVEYARRLVAQRCLYGVDKNPFAVNLAKLSLWLMTLAKDLPFTFVDHALKCGDSLVGLTKQEIVSFGRDAVQDLPLMKYAQEQVLAATVLRSQIQTGDTRSDGDAVMKRSQWQASEVKLLQVRRQGDVAIAAFFDGCGKSKKDREALGLEYGAVVREQPARMLEIAQSLRERAKPVEPFSWEVEFPEVFDRGNPGFDAIVGNPPFIGGKKMKEAVGAAYQKWLFSFYSQSTKNSDLVAYFFRRTYSILRKKGAFGLISTNTVSQGDTRGSGLRIMCNQGCELYAVKKRVKWQGTAAVVASICHGYKGTYQEQKYLNGQSVKTITAFFFHDGGHDDPRPLLANSNKSFIGCDIKGLGFTFDDTNDEVSSIADMSRLIEEEPRNQERIFPYIGGEEVNSSPTHTHHRYVINFGEMTEKEAWQWPALMKIVEEKVKPDRLYRLKGVDNWPWWKFWRTRQQLYDVVKDYDRVLVVSRHSPQWSTAFMRSSTVFSEALVIFATDSNAAFCSLQSRTHEIWARFFGSSMKDDLRYTPSDCFDTFPFPLNWQTSPTLEVLGNTYYTTRADLMIRNNEGLTETYNRFHDPAETGPNIHHLRDLHSQMDRAVLAAYDWPDIPTDCGFALDYLDTESTDLPPEVQTRIDSGDFFFATAAEATSFDNLIRSSVSTRKKKLPWRYRWPESTHDEVLARLLDLNQQRYEEEVKAGLHSKKKGKLTKTKAKGKSKSDNASDQLSLIQE